MTAHNFTTHEKLNEVERLIEEERRMTGRRNELMRAVAADLRARMDGEPSVALFELERCVAAMKREEGRIGFRLRAAQELLARWAVVKQALERFGAEYAQ